MIKFRHPSRGLRAGRDHQGNKRAPLGPGPQARGTLATFLPWKVARPQAEHPLKQNRGFAVCGRRPTLPASARRRKVRTAWDGLAAIPRSAPLRLLFPANPLRWASLGEMGV